MQDLNGMQNKRHNTLITNVLQRVRVCRKTKWDLWHQSIGND